MKLNITLNFFNFLCNRLSAYWKCVAKNQQAKKTVGTENKWYLFLKRNRESSWLPAAPLFISSPHSFLVYRLSITSDSCRIGFRHKASEHFTAEMKCYFCHLAPGEAVPWKTQERSLKCISGTREPTYFFVQALRSKKTNHQFLCRLKKVSDTCGNTKIS